MYSDDLPGKVLDFNYGTHFLFAYHVPEHVLQKENIPALTEEELKEAEAPKDKKMIDSDDDDEDGNKKYNIYEEEKKGEEPEPPKKDTPPK